ncbi:Unconventional myosin-Ie [Leucoagaricus sp. SymC.cos]|nr:Unconventional myosin-Ie [Leucoagaricus sp. SymC.cos]
MTIVIPDVLLAHIASQTVANLEILVSQGQLPDNDCRPLLEKLKSIQDVSRITRRAQGLAITPVASPAPSSRIGALESMPSPFASPGAQVLFRARAVWGYNEHDQDPRDLSFSADDIIDVLSETNGDWWEGRCNGRVGLFPSNHVEKTDSPAIPAPSMDASAALTGEKFASHIPTPNYQPQYITPSPGPAYTPTPLPHPEKLVHMANPPPPTVVVNEQSPPNPSKKHKFHGNFGSTLAHSAVGGVGFGAGSAIGNGLVNAIF